jgi:hypothetical protein
MNPSSLIAGLAAAILDISPFSERTQHEYGNDAHADCRDDCADERAEAATGTALAAALHAHQAVPDKPTRETPDEDRDECGGARSG